METPLYRLEKNGNQRNGVWLFDPVPVGISLEQVQALVEAAKQARATIALYCDKLEGREGKAQLEPHDNFPGGHFNATSSAAAHRGMDILDRALSALSGLEEEG